MKVRVQKLDPKAVIPTYAKHGDAGMDLTAVSFDDSQAEYIEYGTGLALEIPEGYVGLVFPRSSISKMDLSLANSVGVIDSGYRGEVKCRFKRIDLVYDNYYKVGDKIAQLVILPYPKVVFDEVLLLSETERASGGFGSSGK